MEKEFIELLRTVAGSTETLVIWYMIIDLIKTFVEAVAWVACFYLFGKGAAKGLNWLTNQ